MVAQKLPFQFAAIKHSGFGRTSRIAHNDIIHLAATELAARENRAWDIPEFRVR